MDSLKAVNQQPAAGKVLTALLENLRSAPAHRRRDNLGAGQVDDDEFTRSEGGK